jgi:hypothetical protein
MADKTPDQIIVAYKDAFMAANGREPSISYRRGWYRIGNYPSASNYRAYQVEDFTQRLLGRAAWQ